MGSFLTGINGCIKCIERDTQLPVMIINYVLHTSTSSPILRESEVWEAAAGKGAVIVCAPLVTTAIVFIAFINV